LARLATVPADFLDRQAKGEKKEIVYVVKGVRRHYQVALVPCYPLLVSIGVEEENDWLKSKSNMNLNTTHTGVARVSLLSREKAADTEPARKEKWSSLYFFAYY